MSFKIDAPQIGKESSYSAKINSELIGDVLAIRRFVKNQKLLLVQGLQEPDFLNLELLLATKLNRKLGMVQIRVTF
jgi:hypothetical protein